MSSPTATARHTRPSLPPSEEHARAYCARIGRRNCTTSHQEANGMLWRGAKRQLIAGMTVAGCLGIAAMAQAQLFPPSSDHRNALLEGNWQTCREQDGTYAERVYDGKWSGFPPFELHMGP